MIPCKHNRDPEIHRNLINSLIPQLGLLNLYRLKGDGQHVASKCAGAQSGSEISSTDNLFHFSKKTQGILVSTFKPRPLRSSFKGSYFIE